MKIIEILSHDQKLVKLLIYDDSNPLSKDDLKLDDLDLLFEYIYPYQKNSEFSEEVKCELHVFLNNKKISQNGQDTFIDLYILLMCSNVKESIMIKEGLRTQEIQGRIEELLDNKHSVGIGSLNIIANRLEGKTYTGWINKATVRLSRVNG